MNGLEFYLACFFLTFASLLTIWLLIKYLRNLIIIRKIMKNELNRQISSKDNVAGGFKKYTLFKVLSAGKERPKKTKKFTRFTKLCADLDKKEKLVNPFLSNDSSGSSNDKSNMQLGSSGLDPVLVVVGSSSKIISKTAAKINNKLNENKANLHNQLINRDKPKKVSKLSDVESEKIGTSNIYSKETTKTDSKTNQNFKEDVSKLDGYPIDDEIVVKVHKLNNQQKIKPELNTNLFEDIKMNAELLGMQRKSDEKYSLSTVYGPDSMQELLTKKHNAKELKLIKMPEELLKKAIAKRKESELKYSLSAVYAPDLTQELSKQISEKQFTVIKLPEDETIKEVKNLREYKSLESIKSIDRLKESIESVDQSKDQSILPAAKLNKTNKLIDYKKEQYLQRKNLKQHKLVSDTKKLKKLKKLETKEFPLMTKKIKATKIGKDIEIKRPKKYRIKKLFKEGHSLDMNTINDSEEDSVQIPISTISRMSSTDITKKISPSKIIRKK